MDTIGVRAGCSVILFSDSNYNGNSVKIDATRQNNDRWVVFAETAGYFHMDEDVESLRCTCNN